MHYELRRCTEDDRDWAYALKCEAYHEVVVHQFGPWDEDFQRELFAKRWNPAISSVILVGGIPAGLVAFEERNDGLWLDEIQLLAAWRNRGLGSIVIGDLIRRSPLGLQVLKKNFRALTLYRRLGFQDQAETATHFVMRHPGISNKQRPNKSAQTRSLARPV